MCGINGFISTKSVTDAHVRINKMNSSLVHRGPDAEGTILLEYDRGAFGHRRLSIIDIDERSNQPMVTRDGILVYNGELYNFKALKKELDFSFQTESDTEVLLACIEKKGIEYLLAESNGMFAFAYYDRKNGRLLLARDRMGIKPLYYYVDEEVFVFSSEIKGILNSGLVKAQFNESAIDEYLANRYIREPYTFFENIYQLPAGHYLSVNEKLETETTEYWHLPDSFNMETEYDEKEIYNQFKEQLYGAIKRRMISDVPLGTYLSGGVDSSIITAVASLKSDKNLNTYTIGFPELNEFVYSKEVAERYKTIHHEIEITVDDYLKNMQEIIGYKDAPLGVPNEIPLAIMSRELKKDITVVLSGEGADELLGGYGRIFRTPFDFYNHNSGGQESFYDYFIARYEYVPREIRDKYLTIKTPLRDIYDSKVKLEFSKCSNEENVFRFFHKNHVKGLLQRVDATTMLASVEARVPFLDHKLIEFCYENVPYDLKLKWKSDAYLEKAKEIWSSEYSEKFDIPKYLLRKLARELLPEAVVDREKMGFPVPLNQWFLELSEIALQNLDDAYWLRRDNLQELLKECSTNMRSGQILWMFINVELFRKLYFEKEWRY